MSDFPQQRPTLEPRSPLLPGERRKKGGLRVSLRLSFRGKTRSFAFPDASCAPRNPTILHLPDPLCCYALPSTVTTYLWRVMSSDDDASWLVSPAPPSFFVSLSTFRHMAMLK